MKVYHKLVRDKIPEIIESRGAKANYNILNKRDKYIALKQKLVEEATELLNAETQDEIMEELADIETVLEAIWEELNPDQRLEARQKQYTKYREKGGFKNGIFLESVEEEPEK